MDSYLKEILKNTISVKNALIIVVLVSSALVSFQVLQNLWQEKFVELERGLRRYQMLSVKNGSELMSYELLKYVNQGKQLAKSRIFRNSLNGFQSTNDQKFQNAQEDFRNFVKVAGFEAGYLFSLAGRIEVSTVGRIDWTKEIYMPAVKHVKATKKPFYTPLYDSGTGIVSYLFLPVYPAQALSSNVEPIKILCLKVPMGTLLRGFFALDEGLDYKSNIHLVGKVGDTMQEPVFTYPDNLKLQDVGIDYVDLDSVKFGIRKNIYKSKEVYSYGSSIPVVNWLILIETNTTALYAKYDEYKMHSSFLFVFGYLTILFLFCAVNYYVVFYRAKKLVIKMRKELDPLRRERNLYNKICNSIPLPLSFKQSESGKILFANKSFEKVTGLSLSEIEGTTDVQIFDESEADNLSQGDQIVAMSNKSYTHEVQITKQGIDRLMQVQLTPCPYKDKQMAILSVFNDITKQTEQADKSVRVRQQIINALVRAVESVPFLDGHTSLMRKLANEISDTMLLSDSDRATVEAAAILSQVGKTFIPKDLLEKEGKLTPEEVLETQKYVEHTCKILEDIEFELPITKAIWQIQETLDGEGYPNGLEGREISLHARILGVTNTFSALVKVRSYRKAKTAQEAVEILRDMADVKFDSSVIEALQAVVNSSRGKDILKSSHIKS